MLSMSTIAACISRQGAILGTNLTKSTNPFYLIEKGCKNQNPLEKGALKNAVLFICFNGLEVQDKALQLRLCSLSTKTVQGPSLTLEGIHNIHGRDSLAAGMLRVGDTVTDDIFQEYFQHTSSLLIDEAGNSLHTTTTGQTSDCGLSDTLDVVPKDFSVALGTTFSQTFTSFSTPRHS